LPLWLHPLQTVIATITQDADSYAREILETCRAADVRAEADLRNEKISYKVREHSLAKIPFILAVGKKEAADRSVSVRTLGSQEQQTLSIEDLIKKLRQATAMP
jgi:threonyl-tRNA synthetase